MPSLLLETYDYDWPSISSGVESERCFVTCMGRSCRILAGYFTLFGIGDLTSLCVVLHLEGEWKMYVHRKAKQDVEDF